MSFTVSVRSVLESAETLARRSLGATYGAWNVANFFKETLSLAYNQTLTLPVGITAATTYVIECDPLATVNIGWVYNGNTVELPVNQVSIVMPPVTPYVRNTSTSSTSNPVPVRVFAFA
jgi:hypothetical protein